MNGHISRWVATANPFRELAAADCFGFEQGTIAMVDVLEHAIANQCPQLLMVRVGKLVVNDFGQNTVTAGQGNELIQFVEAQDGRLLDKHMLAGLRAWRAASKWRSSGVAMQIDVDVAGRAAGR